MVTQVLARSAAKPDSEIEVQPFVGVSQAGLLRTGRHHPLVHNVHHGVSRDLSDSASDILEVVLGHGASRRALRYSSGWAMPPGSGSREARIHTSCAVVTAPILDRTFARWCFTVECDMPRRRA